MAPSAVVLETIGKGAAATKYNLMGGISNAAIIYMAFFDGWAHDKWGSNGFLYVDAASNLIGTLIFVAAAFSVKMLAERLPARA